MDQELILRIIEPRGETLRCSNVLASAPDLFVEFANINDSEARLLDFVNRHGLLFPDPSLYVATGLERVAEFLEVFGQFESDKPTGSKRWLSLYDELRPSAETEGNDLKVVPKIEAGAIQIWLEPPDLLSAIWLQFLLSAADDMTVTHCHCCPNFIAVAGSLGRTDKRFCSAACKQRNYRMREAEKRAIVPKGVSARRITNRRRSK